jgi:hypothetical protein
MNSPIALPSCTIPPHAMAGEHIHHGLKERPVRHVQSPGPQLGQVEVSHLIATPPPPAGGGTDGLPRLFLRILAFLPLTLVLFALFPRSRP